MQQLDLFDITLEGKINRLERWIGRLNREMQFLKCVYELKRKVDGKRVVEFPVDQIDMFG